MDTTTSFIDNLISSNDGDRPSHTLPLETGVKKALLIYLCRMLGTVLYGCTAVVLALVAVLDDRYFVHMGNIAIFFAVILQALVIFAMAAIGLQFVGSLQSWIPREVRALLAPYFACLFLITVPILIAVGAVAFVHELLA
jgi:hypothetical protein